MPFLILMVQLQFLQIQSMIVLIKRNKLGKISQKTLDISLK